MIKELDEEICRKLSNVRRPLVLVRGKPITVEQTMQLITGEEALFSEAMDDACRPGLGRRTRALEGIFYSPGNVRPSTWVYADGTIGGNMVSRYKYPELDEILDGYMHLGKQYPFLDMVISYTMYDECTCYGCEICEEDGWEILCRSSDCACKDCIPYLDKIEKYAYWNGGWSEDPDFEELYFRNWDASHVRSDVGDSVALTIGIHQGETEVLFGEKARSRFHKYNHLYGALEYAFLFTGDLVSYGSTCMFDKKFVEDCFAFIGKPRSLCEEYVERKLLSPFPENARVITKEWVIEQYHTYIGGNRLS